MMTHPLAASTDPSNTVLVALGVCVAFMAFATYMEHSGGPKLTHEHRAAVVAWLVGGVAMAAIAALVALIGWLAR